MTTFLQNVSAHNNLARSESEKCQICDGKGILRVKNSTSSSSMTGVKNGCVTSGDDKSRQFRDPPAPRLRLQWDFVTTDVLCGCRCGCRRSSRGRRCLGCSLFPHQYRDAVRGFADSVLKYGRDTYGPEQTPLFVDGLHIHRLAPVANCSTTSVIT